MKSTKSYLAKIICINIVFIISINIGFAQWISTNFTNGTFLSFAMQGTNLLAGNANGLYRTADSGVTWTTLNNSFPGSYVNAILVKDSIVLVGTAYGVYKSTNYGSTWLPDTVGLPFVFSGQCPSKTFLIKDSTVFTGLGAGGIYKRNIHSNLWTAVNNGIAAPSTTSINEFTMDANAIYAASDAQGYIYKSLNNGANWYLANSGMPFNAQIKAICCIGSTIYAGTYNNGIYKSTNQGVSWTLFNTGIPSNTQISSFVSTGSCLFAGTYNNGVYLLLGGSTIWNAVNTGLIQNKIWALLIGNGYIYAGSWDGGTNREFCKRLLSDFKPNTPGILTGINNLCAGVSSSYLCTSSNLSSSYFWSISPSSAGILSNTDTIATIIWNNTFSGLVTINVQGVNCFGNSVLSNSSNVTINPTYTNNISTAICQGDTYTFPDATTSTSTIVHTSHFSTINLCDSSIITTLTVNPTFTNNVSTSICQGDTYTFPDATTATSATVHTSHFSTINSCDSSIVTTLTVNPIYTSNVSASICQGDTYTFPDATTATSATVQTSHFSTINSCDSSIVTTLSVTSIDTAITQSGMTLTANQTGATYQWLDCTNNYSLLSGEINQTITALVMDPTYAVEITISGCVDTLSCIFILTEGINEPSNDNLFSIYPNPSSGQFTINTEGIKLKEIRVTDVLGRIVLVANINSANTTIDLSKETKGVYFVKLSDENNNSVNKKIIKE